MSNTKKEPAPVPAETSSKNSNKISVINDITDELICQALKDVADSHGSILSIYETMSEDEQRAFDLGETYRALLYTENSLKKLKGRCGDV